MKNFITNFLNKFWIAFIVNAIIFYLFEEDKSCLVNFGSKCSINFGLRIIIQSIVLSFILMGLYKKKIDKQ